MANRELRLPHLHWPFFEPRHHDLAQRFAQWAAANLEPYESDEGGDGRAARDIFRLLGRDGWLRHTVPQDPRDAAPDIRVVCLMRELCGYSSAMADVALSEPWLGALPLMMAADEMKQRYLAGYIEGSLLPAFALSEPDAGSDVQAIAPTARQERGPFVH